MTLTDAETMARQAKQIMELSDEVESLKNRMSRARLYIICIGGPLNDNKLHYTGDQLVTFSKILEELED